MKLNLEYLCQRHEYWKYEIGKAGIWNPLQFGDVLIEIGRKSKNYNGVFKRRRTIRKGIVTVCDKIVLYNNADDFEPMFIDSVLVHEMIHQYITQNSIKDTSAHGKIFKSFMKKINHSFPGELQINLKAHNPSAPNKGAGLTIHYLMKVWNSKEAYCCVVHPKSLHEIERLVKRLKRSGTISGYSWAQSVDVHFNSYSRCMKRLRGIKRSKREMEDFCKEYNVIEIGEKWLTLRKADKNR